MKLFIKISNYNKKKIFFIINYINNKNDIYLLKFPIEIEYSIKLLHLKLFFYILLETTIKYAKNIF